MLSETGSGPVARGRFGFRKERARIALTAVLAVLSALAVRAQGPKFFPDDPIAVDRDSEFDASEAAPFELGNYSDFAENTFFSPGDRRKIRALNVNTLDEVPDSSWFTNRIGRRPMSIEEIVRGPDRAGRLDVQEWLIVAGKSSGFQPGFRAIDPSDPSKQLYQVEFDSASNPEMATGAELIGTALYHAIGYNVVDVYLVEVDPRKIRISEEATIRDLRGRRRFVQSDLEAILKISARGSAGRYRALASRFVEGKNLGQFRYYGTRPDDPNDIYPHEHRRELRANRVFAAWLNHDDSRANNSLDMLVGPEGGKYIRHYMFDFGSILGSATRFPDHPRSGREYTIDAQPALATLATLGLYIRPWLLVRYPDNLPSAVGRFDGDSFEPEKWKPEYPNAAFRNLRPDDAFWAARIVAAFSEEAIRAVVGKARYSDPRASEYLTRTLVKRRDEIARAWLTGVNPIVNPVLSPDGWLSFENAAEGAGAARGAAQHALSWSRFDSLAATHHPAKADERVSEPRVKAPLDLLTGSEYISVAIRTSHPDYPGWARPVQVYFRRERQGWTTVGLERE